jgi:hypothetical protein
MSLSAEELELLRTDPELLQLQKELADRRVADARAELDDMERTAALDEAVEAPLAALRDSGKAWRAWSSSWAVLIDHEKALLKSLEQLAERLMWVEEDEEGSRCRVAAAFAASLSSLKSAELKARRHLLDSVAWADDWMAVRDGEWAEWRQRAAAQKHEICFAREERRVADEAEIERLERRERELLS